MILVVIPFVPFVEAKLCLLWQPWQNFCKQVLEPLLKVLAALLKKNLEQVFSATVEVTRMNDMSITKTKVRFGVMKWPSFISKVRSDQIQVQGSPEKGHSRKRQKRIRRWIKRMRSTVKQPTFHEYS